MTSIDNREWMNEKLVAYLDGELPVGEAAEVEEMIANRADVKDAYEKLVRLNPPFKEAFEPLLAAPIPEKLSDLIADTPLESDDNPSGRRRGGFLAAALVGLLVGGGVTTMMWRTPLNQTPDWISQIANYQSLYIRPTVESAPTVDWKQVENLIESNLGRQVPVPNLSQNGVEFKRGQLLQVNSKPLVQLAYLPEAGIPLAICIMRDSHAETVIDSPQYGSSHGLSYAAWQHGDLKFVLVSDAPSDRVREWAATAIAQTVDS
ncbi:MAG: hypothetical protein AAF402_01540 [Pseudomonadota bacterium]